MRVCGEITNGSEAAATAPPSPDAPFTIELLCAQLPTLQQQQPANDGPSSSPPPADAGLAPNPGATDEMGALGPRPLDPVVHGRPSQRPRKQQRRAAAKRAPASHSDGARAGNEDSDDGGDVIVDEAGEESSGEEDLDNGAAAASRRGRGHRQPKSRSASGR
jgi:hypothetical protein